MNIGIASLTPISPEEKMWLDSLPWPFDKHHVSDSERYHVFMCIYPHEHFNPNGYTKFYVQHRHFDYTLEAKHEMSKQLAYNMDLPLYLPTGTFSVDHGTNTLCCLDGLLHDASGYPAFTSNLFGNEYYLHGKNYQPIDYFRYMEKEKNQYPEYQSHKYIEFMASVLGKKD